MGDDRRAGWCDALAGYPVVDDLEVAQEPSHSWGRDRQWSVGRPYRARSQRQRSDGPALCAYLLDAPGGAHDVGDGVPVGKLVEVHVVDGHAVDRRLGNGESGEDVDGPLLDGGFEIGDLQPLAYPAPLAGLGAVVEVVLVGIGAQERDPPPRQPVRDSVGHIEPPCGRKAAGPHGCFDARREVRPRVDAGGQEHVASYPTHGIEVNQHRLVLPEASRTV